MADLADIVSRWRCRRYAARLVDLADETLAAPLRERVERHVQTCDRCREALDDLRDVPNLLRETAATPGEAFWQRQRRDIMRAIRNAEPATVPRQRALPVAAWRGGLVAVATALLAVASYRILQPRPAPPLASRHAGASSIDDLEGDAMVALSELISNWEPRSELLPAGREIDPELADQLSRSAWLESASANDALAGDLDETEWDQIDELPEDRAS